MSRLSELLAKAKAQTAIQLPVPTVIADAVNAIVSPSDPNQHYGTDRYGKSIAWNAEQWQFISTIQDGKSAVLIGPAGTGKTTSTNGGVQALLQSKYFPPMRDKHKHLPINSPHCICLIYSQSGNESKTRIAR